jgi:two-component system cell cycle response regulator DivK
MPTYLSSQVGPPSPWWSDFTDALTWFHVGSRRLYTTSAVHVKAQPMIRKAKILVVEDDHHSMLLMHELLLMHGYEALQAWGGFQGWELAQQHHPDLILLDIRLRDVSGMEMAKWLKCHQVLQTIPIIAVTALAMKGDKEKLLANGCDEYIPKPISISDLLKKIEHLLHSSAYICVE